MPALSATHTRNTGKKLCFFLVSACLLITMFILFQPGILPAQSARDDALSLTETFAAKGLRELEILHEDWGMGRAAIFIPRKRATPITLSISLTVNLTTS